MGTFKDGIRAILESYMIELPFDSKKHNVVFEFDFDKIEEDIDKFASALIENEIRNYNQNNFLDEDFLQ